MECKCYMVEKQGEKHHPSVIKRREPGLNDIVIKIMYCGVCHSDIHTCRGEWGPDVFPSVTGHEIVGKVIKVGNNVSKLNLDDIAGVGCLVDSCGNCCYCYKSDEQHCSRTVFTYGSKLPDGSITMGGYSQIIVVDQKFVFNIPKSLAIDKVAPLLCAGVTTFAPLNRANIKKGMSVAVVGLGGLGHMGVKFAVAFGAEVTVISTSESKKQDAIKLGAKHFLFSKDPQQVKDAVKSFDFILDTVAASHDYVSLMSMLRPYGHMVLVGVPPNNFTLNPQVFIHGRCTLSGSLIGGINETQEMLDFCAKYNILPEVEMISIDKIDEAHDRVVKSDVKYRFVIDMSTLS